MRTVVVSLASCIVLLSATPAEAQGSMEPFLSSKPSLPPDSGLSIGARFAYGIPLGNLSGATGDSFSNAVSGGYPLQLDLGYRFTPNIYVGAFIQYAFLSIGDICVTGASCSGHDIRVGADVIYTFTPQSKLMPWVGLGFGYEWLKYTFEASGQSADVTVKGWEFAHFSVGLDYRVASFFRVGPFATFTLAQFSTYESPVPPGGTAIGATQTYDITNKSLHEWLQLGIKGTFDF